MTRKRDKPLSPVALASWKNAREYAAHIARGGALPPISLAGLVLQHGEQAVFDTRATYMRWYGMDVTYGQSSFFAYGSAAFVVGSAVGSVIGNSSRRRQAESLATPQWREHHDAAVVATTERLLINTASNGWLSFYFNSVQEFHPDPLNWKLTLGWPDTVPLRLQGLAVPYVSVHAARFIFGDGWVNEPSMAALLPSSGS